MEFTNRTNQPFRANTPAPQPEHAAKDTTKKSKRGGYHKDLPTLAAVILLFSVALVLAGAIFLLTRSSDEDKLAFVDTKGYQAVDVVSGGTNGDQVYFGKIASITDSQIVLLDVFYPIAGQQNTSTTTLVPFVCSLATPKNHLIINRSQVAYWYNLQSESKVTKTIDEYKKANKDKANCDSLNANTTNPAGTNPTTEQPAANGAQNNQETPAANP